MRAYVAVQVGIYSFLKSAVDGDKWSASRTSHFTSSTPWTGSWVGPRARTREDFIPWSAALCSFLQSTVTVFLLAPNRIPTTLTENVHGFPQSLQHTHILHQDSHRTQFRNSSCIDHLIMLLFYRCVSRRRTGLSISHCDQSARVWRFSGNEGFVENDQNVDQLRKNWVRTYIYIHIYIYAWCILMWLCVEGKLADRERAVYWDH